VKGRRHWVAAGLLLMAVVTGAVVLWRCGLYDLWMDRARLEALLTRIGRSGPLLIVALQIAQTLVAPIPGQIVGLAAGFLYGPWWGALYCVLGSLVGTLLATWLARTLGRPLVERWVGTELLARFDGLAERRGALALFLIFLLPFLPDDLICLAAGLTCLPLPLVGLLALLGRTPGIAVSTLIGAQSANLTLGQMLIVGGVGLILSLPVFRYQQPLQDWMFRLVERSSSDESR